MDIETSNKQPTTRFHSAKGRLQTIERKTRPIQAFINKFNNDWVMNFAGILAYNLLTAMLPIAIALLGTIGLILNYNATLLNSIETQIGKIVPGSQDAFKQALTQLQHDAGILVFIAILIAIFGGSRLFVTLEGCLDILYRVRPRTLIRQNLVAIAMLLLFIVLIPIMVFASVAPSFIFTLLAETPLKSIPIINSIISPNGQISFTIGSVASSLIVSFILFEAIYFVVPNQRISWRNSWRGAVVAAVLLDLFLFAFPLYVSRFLSGYAGQIGFAVILLLFFYYFAVILLLGAEVNAFVSEKIQPLPNDLVTFVSTMAGKLNEKIPETEAKIHQDTQPTDVADDTHIYKEFQQNKLDM